MWLEALGPRGAEPCPRNPGTEGRAELEAVPSCLLFFCVVENSGRALQLEMIGIQSARWGEQTGPMGIHCNFHDCATGLRSETAALAVGEGCCDVDYWSAVEARGDSQA